MLTKKQKKNLKDVIQGGKKALILILLLLFLYMGWKILELFMASLFIFTDVLKAGIVNLTPEMALIVTGIALYISFKLLSVVIDIIIAILKYVNEMKDDN